MKTSNRTIVSRFGEDAIKKKQEEEEERMQQEKDQETTWYHEGPEALRVSRLWIASEKLNFQFVRSTSGFIIYSC
jgi:U4/U6 small nuclear ribonucleoprotein PRP4